MTMNERVCHMSSKNIINRMLLKIMRKLRLSKTENIKIKMDEKTKYQNNQQTLMNQKL